MSATDAAALYDVARNARVRCWVMGGWGVDALLGRQTRPHHDLDLLVLTDDLPQFDQAMTAAGFARRYLWDDENLWVTLDGVPWATAFVMSDAAERELDVHAVDLTDGLAVAHCAVPWTFGRGALDGIGVIDQAAVACLSVEAQLNAHVGYELPETHLQDMRLLAQLRSTT
jgi:lincosamide nucleotidyltransferase A/C/D/E